MANKSKLPLSVLNNLNSKKEKSTMSLIEYLDPDKSLYISNVDSKVNEEILIELFVQCGPVTNVYIPKDKISGETFGYAFIEFRTEMDTDYANKVMDQIKLFGKPIKTNKASLNRVSEDVGANLFVGNLPDGIDDVLLKELFFKFGNLINVRIDSDSDGKLKNYGFVHFDRFESSDLALKTMNNYILKGNKLKVEYAFKENSKSERHGSLAERVIAANKNIANNENIFHKTNENLNLELKEDHKSQYNSTSTFNPLPNTVPIFHNNNQLNPNVNLNHLAFNNNPMFFNNNVNMNMNINMNNNFIPLPISIPLPINAINMGLNVTNNTNINNNNLLGKKLENNSNINH